MQAPPDITKAAAIPRKSGRSAVFWAIWDDYKKLSALPGINWAELAAEMGRAGIRDGKRECPSARTVMDTYRKVREIKINGKKPRKKRKDRSRFARSFKDCAAPRR